MTSGVVVHADGEAAGRAVAERVCELASEAAARRGAFSVAISGGKTPEPMFAALAASAAAWDRWAVYWCDERLVAPDDPRSNFGLARRLWLAPAHVPMRSVHPVHTAGSAGQAAERYEDELRALPTGPNPGAAAVGVLDAVVLGIGPDGHTASLFPGSPTLGERARWVVPEPNPALEPKVPRVTLTFPALRHARHAIFVVSGAEKRPTLERILNDPERGTDSAKLPAARVTAAESVEWHVDRAAWPEG